MRRSLYILLPWPGYKRWSCNTACVTGRMVFLTLTKNSSICSNSVSLAWVGSYMSICTTVVICPETQRQRVKGCYGTYLLQGGNTSLPLFFYLIHLAEARALPWACPRLSSTKNTGGLMLYLGVVSALHLHPPLEGALPVSISPPSGQGIAPALLLPGSWVLWCPSG